MEWAEFTEGKSTHLTQHDVDPPQTFTIRGASKDHVEDKAKRSKDEKVVVHWVEDIKPWIPSTTDRRALQAMFPQAKTASALAGVRITLHRDPTVRFGNGRNAEVCGGIRIMGSPDIEETGDVQIKLGTSTRMTTIHMTKTEGPDPLAAACEAIGVDVAALSAEVQASTGYRRATAAYALRHLSPDRVAALKARNTTQE
jgi:hypothetical protein